MKNPRHKTKHPARTVGLATAALLLLAPPAACAADFIIGDNQYEEIPTGITGGGVYSYDNIIVGRGTGTGNQIYTADHYDDGYLDVPTIINVSQSLIIGDGESANSNSILMYGGTLNMGASASAVIIGKNGSGNGLSISGYGTPAAFNLQGNTTVNIGYSDIYGGDSSTGNALTVAQDGTLSFTGPNGLIKIGDYNSNANNLNINGTANTYAIATGSDSSDNSINIGATGNLNAKGDITLGAGYGSDNILTIENGGQLNFTGNGRQLTIGSDGGSNNTVTVKAGATLDNTSGQINVGIDNGYGTSGNTLDISGKVNTASLTIGEKYSHENQVIINTGGELSVSGSIYISQDFDLEDSSTPYDNTLHVNGGKLSASAITVGTGESSYNNLKVSGGTLSAGDIHIGTDKSSGNIFDITAGKVTASNVYITNDGTGDYHGSSNSLSVSGTGELTVTGNLGIGTWGGTGTATISNDGKVTTNSVSIGTGESAGNSSLAITNGGTLNTNFVSIGNTENPYSYYDTPNAGPSSLTIDANSQLNSTGANASFDIGYGGFGHTLTLKGKLNTSGNTSFTIGGNDGHDNRFDIDGGVVEIKGKGTFSIGANSGPDLIQHDSGHIQQHTANTLQIYNGGKLTIEGNSSAVHVGDNNGVGWLNISGPGSQLNLSGVGAVVTVDSLFPNYDYSETYIDMSYIDEATLNKSLIQIYNGGQLNLSGANSALTIGRSSVGNNLSVSGTNSQINLTGANSTLTVGRDSEYFYQPSPPYEGEEAPEGYYLGNTLTIYGGNKVNLTGANSQLIIGDNSRANSLNLAGQLDITQSSSTLTVGSNGGKDNRLNITNGGTLDAKGNIVIGKGATSSNNTLSVYSGGILKASTVYVGDTGSTGNRLHVDGTLSAAHIEIAANSILSGHGIINVTSDSTLAIQSGGILDISGDTGTGTLTVNDGPVTFAAGAILDFNLDPLTSASDVLALNGQTINLSGVLFQFDVLNEFTTDLAFDLITGAGGITVDAGAVYDLGGGYTGRLSVTNGGSVLQLSASAVPEPSTYAALAGLVLLAYAIIRRSTTRA